LLSSSIISEYGGNVNIAAGGDINIGTQEQIGASSLTRGIVSLWAAISMSLQMGLLKSMVRVLPPTMEAVFLLSQKEGNVDAGTGGADP